MLCTIEDKGTPGFVSLPYFREFRMQTLINA